MRLTNCCERLFGYNLDIIAIHKLHSEETKKRMAESAKRVFTPERLRKLLAGKRPSAKGRKMNLTEEERERRRLSAKEQWNTKGLRKKIKAANSHPMNPSTKQKISDYWAKRRADKEAEQPCLF